MGFGDFFASIGSASNATGKAVVEFAKNQVVPAIQKIGATTLGLAKRNLAHAAPNTMKLLHDFTQQRPHSAVLKHRTGPIVKLRTRQRLGIFDRIRSTLSRIGQNVCSALRRVVTWVRVNPWTTLLVMVMLVVAAVMISNPAGVLGAAGFGATGVTGGSLAAGIQAIIGNVAAGGTFATLTSAAMGGYGVAVIFSIIQGVGGVLGLASILMFLQGIMKDDGRDIGKGDGAESDIDTNEKRKD